MRKLQTALVTAGLAGIAAMTSSLAHAQAADWSGPYVGAAVGYADRKESSGETILFDRDLNGAYGDTVTTAAGANAFSPGFCGGSYLTNAAAGGCSKDDDTDTEFSLRAGWDWQYGAWVVGAVGEYAALELQDAVTGFSTTPASYNFTRKLEDVWAVRARGGYAFGPTLVYATGGYASGHVKHSFQTTNTANSFTRSGGGRADGYQIGLGAEHQFLPNVSVGVEWLRTRLTDDGYTVRAGNTGATPATNPFLLGNTQGTDFLRAAEKIKYDTVRATVSYRF